MDYRELKLLEDDLWEAADQLRANSKLTASEYSMPVLGLIFLRHATTRFHALLPDVEKAVPARATGALREDRIKLGFQGKAAIYLPEAARYDFLAALPAGTNVGEAIRDAMIAIEDSVTDQKGQKLLEGALPKDYLGLEQDLLAELLKIFNRPALADRHGRCVRAHLRILSQPVRAERCARRRRVLHAAQPGAHDRQRDRARPWRGA
jgi:type I restriction enzyme M protein